MVLSESVAIKFKLSLMIVYHPYEIKVKDGGKAAGEIEFSF